MPEVIVSGRPNGLPMATTSCPGCTCDESPNVSGCRSDAGTSTLITAMSDPSSAPTSVAFTVLPLLNWTEYEVPPSTTCAFVTMSPFVSTTKPEPSDCVCSAPPKKLFVDVPVTVISTTPGVTSL